MNELKDIISEYVGVPSNEIQTDMSLLGDIGLDSFGMISLITAIEDTFEVSIPECALPNFQTLDDLGNFLSKNSKVYVA